MSDRPLVAVVVFPGSNDDRDAAWALGSVGAEPTFVWHEEAALPKGTGAVVLPGGFSYGDYLRTGAIASVAPVMDAVRDFAAAGGPVLGICNGFQVLCEARLLPGVLRPNRQLEFVCRDVALRVETVDSVFLHRCAVGQELVIPVKHGEGAWYADEGTFVQLAARGQIVLRYTDDVNGALGNVAGVVNETGNVMGLMPHPEHAVDPLLGSADGGLLLAALVDAAAAHRCARSLLEAHRTDGRSPSQGARPSAPSVSLRTGARSSAARSRSRSRARIVTGPRRADPSVVYANRMRRSPPRASSSWTTTEKRLSPTRCGTAASSRSSLHPMGLRVSAPWRGSCRSKSPPIERTGHGVTYGPRLRAESVTT